MVASVNNVEKQEAKSVLSGDNALSSGNTIAKSPQTPKENGFIKPLDGSYIITSEYGTREHPTTGVVKNIQE